MDDELTFSTRDEFRAWLGDNGEASGGVWLVFGKSGGPKTLKASEALEAIIAGHEPAASNFRAMSPSVRRTYTRAYFDAKTDAGREKRLAWMLDRLERNLKPM